MSSKTKSNVLVDAFQSEAAHLRRKFRNDASKSITRLTLIIALAGLAIMMSIWFS